jgi:hypothetical protein
MLFGCDHRGPEGRRGRRTAIDLRDLSQDVDRSTMSQPLTPGQLL